MCVITVAIYIGNLNYLKMSLLSAGEVGLDHFRQELSSIIFVRLSAAPELFLKKMCLSRY